MKGFNLELKLQEKNQADGVFYRYRFGETQFWFTQNSDGNIYAVSIRNEKYPSVNFYADDTKDQYYPDRIRFQILQTDIASYNDENNFNKMFQYLCGVRSELQRFFEISKHARLYWENHKGK